MFSTKQNVFKCFEVYKPNNLQINYIPETLIIVGVIIFLNQGDVPFPVEFHGVRGEESLSAENPTYENLQEATKIVEILKEITKKKKSKKQILLSSICVVSLYPAQVCCRYFLCLKLDHNQMYDDADKSQALRSCVGSFLFYLLFVGI